MIDRADVVRSTHSGVALLGDLTWPDETPPELLDTDVAFRDVSIVPNLEGPILTERGERHRRGATCGLWNGRGVLEWLAGEAVELVGAANNHITDFPLGARRTLERLGPLGVHVGGAGRTSRDAARPARMILSDGAGVTTLFIGDWRVGCVRPRRGRVGANTPSEEWTCACIRQLRSDYQRDTIVASVHGGEELQAMPSPYIRSWLRALAEAGANVVVAHHPHLSHGVERVGASWVFYSLGNMLMGAREYDGVRVAYPAVANQGIGVIIRGAGVSVVRLEADPDGGKVRVHGPHPPEEEPTPGFLDLDDASYAAAYRRARRVAWWYPMWTGSEAAGTKLAKATWLRSVQTARGAALGGRRAQSRVVGGGPIGQ